MTVVVDAEVSGTDDFGAFGRLIGEVLEASGKVSVPYIVGVERASLEELKSFCASIATYGGVALFHMISITPEAAQFGPPKDVMRFTQADIANAKLIMNDALSDEVDFVSLGCPHLSIKEIARIAELLAGKRVTKEF